LKHRFQEREFTVVAARGKIKTEQIEIALVTGGANTDDLGVATLTMDRPVVHNALTAELIEALNDRFARLDADPPRALVLSGSGASFSAGADLGWMRAMADADEAANRADAERLAAMFRALDALPCPTIARVHGAAFGGGVGLVGCCVMGIAADTAKFGLTEVRLGLIPATISPFVLARIGRTHARRWFLTGERFDAMEARRIGLVDSVVGPDALDEAISARIEALLACGPAAVSECKALIRRVEDFDGGAQELDSITAEWIARIRVSEEGQAGLRAFLEKRRPDWKGRSSS
ncbi:MAG: enoyl-CoA hydratase-related protein, partial [Wenzhouxiangellaceae bacterium]|nr:enoyl-CoA hydratase-related protein [Wenzhouxiangellaceae bacterium]